MTEQTFQTPRPVDLYVEIRRGRVEVTATDTDRTTVSVDGPADAEEVQVEQRGDAVRIVAPSRSGLLGRDPEYDVRVTVPTTTRLTTRTGSADVTARGRFGDVQLEAGSGDLQVDDVDGEAHVKTGSGDVVVDRVAGDATVKTGSGDVRLGETGGSLVVTTGSGDLLLGGCTASATLRTGSGDVRVAESSGDLAISTGSGSVDVDLARRGSVQVKGASGDLRLGVPAGTPVWTDITTASGRVHSDLEGVGAPEEGQDHLEVRARTASGDVSLVQR